MHYNLQRPGTAWVKAFTFLQGDDPIQNYTLHQIYGTLIFNLGGSSSGQVTFHSFPLSFFSRPAIEGAVVLTIPLTVYQPQQIESQRAGDISLKFDFTFEFAKHYPVPASSQLRPLSNLKRTSSR